MREETRTQIVLVQCQNRCCTIGKVTRPWDRRCGGANTDKKKIFWSSQDRPGWLPGQPTLQFNRYQGSLPEARDTDHSPPPSAEVKKEWNYTSTLPLYAFITRKGKTLPFLVKSTLAK